MHFEIPQNYEIYLKYLPYLLMAVAVGLLLTPVAGYIARRFNIIGNPPSLRAGKKASDFRHLEKQPTPLLGGLAVILPLIILTIIFTKESGQMIYFLVCAGILFAAGILDDIFDIPGPVQLGIQLLVAVIMVLSPANLNYIGNPLGGVIYLDKFIAHANLFHLPIEVVLPGDLFLGAWILICINAVKWVAGTDGLMEGNTMIASLVLFLLNVRLGSGDIATVSIMLAGLLLGFLFFNFYPAKIRSGSAGKSTFGFLIAGLSLMSSAKLATGIVILLLPIIDFIWVIVARFIRHRPQNPLKILLISDQTHLHHNLLELGLTERQVAFAEYSVTILLGAIALAVSGALRAFILVIAVVFIFGFIFLIRYLVIRKQRQRPSEPGETTPEARYSY